jgi:adenosylcobinamide-GDP ribazoletransferase
LTAFFVSKRLALQFIRHFLLAVQFFTRIPVTGKLADWVGYSPEMLRASAAHFAGVGYIVGAVAALVYVAVEAVLPTGYAPLVAAALCLAATMLLTGGFHEDGLADLADGLGGAYSRERALEIMKDSRIGAFGAMALVVVLVTKIGLLASLGSFEIDFVVLMIFCSHVVSRALPMGTVALLPHVGDAAGSKSKPLADQINATALMSNVFWCFLPIAGVFITEFAIEIIAGCVLAALAWLVMLWRLKRRLQGFTGDALGATQQMCEIAFLLGALIATASPDISP